MKVATITCLGQHPKGLSLHLRNLQWAVDRPHERYIVSKTRWRLKGDCKFYLCDKPLGELTAYWNKEIPDLLRSIDADVVLFSEMDMIYTTHLGEHIDAVYAEDCLVMNSDIYGWDILKEGEIIYQRIWEGGLIVRYDRLMRHLNTEGELGWSVSSGSRKIVRENFDGEYIISPGNVEMLLTDVPASPVEVLFDFQLRSFYEKTPTRREKILIHLPRPETIHRLYPWVYDEISQFHMDRLHKETRDTIANTLFLYVMSGVTTFNPVVKRFIHGDSTFHCLDPIARNAREWMSPEEQDRFADLAAWITRQVPMT